MLTVVSVFLSTQVGSGWIVYIRSLTFSDIVHGPVHMEVSFRLWPVLTAGVNSHTLVPTLKDLASWWYILLLLRTAFPMFSLA
jgi:hypothetical protein